MSERRREKDGAARGKGEVTSIEGGQRTTSSPAPIMILPVQRKLANLADVPSALSLSSEEQYSKCTYPLCFDFSQCPLTQPFHVFVYNHHFRELFNLKYPATVDNFVTSSSLLLTRPLSSLIPVHSTAEDVVKP